MTNQKILTKYRKILYGILFSIIFLNFSGISAAQDYPKEIRGYKVHKTKVSVKNEGEKNAANDDSEAFATLGEPRVSGVSLTGFTLEIPVKMSAIEQSGKVDFLTFNDFIVNDLSVSIEEYTESFAFEKNKPVDLPKPIKVFIGTGQALLGGWKEMRDSKEEWDVKGTVFVFGKFKKYGFSFKRVVPVPVNVKIKNPLKKYRGLVKYFDNTNIFASIN